MAATLIHIKSKMLLPRPETAAGVEGEEEDPRDALVRRLLEHQKFKAAAGPAARARAAARGAVAASRRAGRGRSPATTTSRSSRSICSACSPRSRRWSSAPSSARRCCCRPEQMPVEVRIEQLLARLSETEACGFEELFADVDDRAGLIVTFLALLEMIRLKLVQGLPGRQLRADPRLQAAAAGRCAASDWRSGGTPWLMTRRTSATTQDGRRERRTAGRGR